VIIYTEHCRIFCEYITFALPLFVRYTYAGINVIYEDECGIGMQEKTIIVNKTWQHFFIFVLALADFMGALDATIVVISLPSIAHDFNASTSMVSWVLIAYMLIIASFLLVFGKLGDLKGLKTGLYCRICHIHTRFIPVWHFRVYQLLNHLSDNSGDRCRHVHSNKSRDGSHLPPC